MWTLKMKFWHEGSTIIPYTKKFNITGLSFPMNRFEKDGMMYLTAGHVILGKKENIEKYYEEIQKDKRLQNIEMEGNMLVYTIAAKKGASHLQMYLSPELIFVKPIIIKPDGFEYLEVAALRKQVLTDFLKIAQKWVHIELQKITNEKIRDFYIPHMMPEITEKQKQAITLAYKNGYYDYPKRIEIQRLAEIAKTSPSTFQEHLRKAEQKLIPFFLENIIHEG